MKVWSARRAAAGIAVTLVAVFVSACGGKSFDVKLASTGASNYGKGEATIGVIAELANRSGGALTIKTASLIPLRRYPLPELVKTAVLVDRHGQPTMNQTTGVRLGPSAYGRTVDTGKTIEFAYFVKAPGPGRYETAGIRLRVEAGGTVRTLIAYGGSAVCDTIGQRISKTFTCYRN